MVGRLVTAEYWSDVGTFVPNGDTAVAGYPGLRGGQCAFGRPHASALARMTPALDPAGARSTRAGAVARGALVWLPG
jgi:hypothetical protein